VQALSESEIRGSFVNCSRGVAKTAALPAAFRDLDWSVLEFLGWRDPKAPTRGYIVVPHADRLLGIALRAPNSTTGRVGSGLCNLCHSARAADEILLFVAPRAGAAGRRGNTVGTYICADLACSLYARGVLKLTGLQPENLPPDQRVERLHERLGGFVGRVLEPGPDGAPTP
jgi:FBP C-terminal treble-clef zinc-finger